MEWWRFTNENDTNNFIDAVDKSSFSNNRVDSHESSIANITGDFGENLQLKTTSGDYRVIGHYVPTFRFNMSLELVENGQRFIVYSKFSPTIFECLAKQCIQTTLLSELHVYQCVCSHSL